VHPQNGFGTGRGVQSPRHPRRPYFTPSAAVPDKNVRTFQRVHHPRRHAISQRDGGEARLPETGGDEPPGQGATALLGQRTHSLCVAPDMTLMQSQGGSSEAFALVQKAYVTLTGPCDSSCPLPGRPSGA
jgi:hypothetical protein